MNPNQPGDELIPVKCLIVDDLEENTLVLSVLLRNEGVELLVARSGVEALELLLVHDVALVLLDVQMPEMDGFEVAELMRGSERTRHVPIIFITAGVHDQNHLFKGYDSGAVDFLYKPIDARILQNKANVFFDLHRHKLRLARELHERNQALRLNEMFMAVLGHDLRSPLSAILMSAAMVQRLAKEERMSEIAKLILSSGDRMRAMIEDLLDVARVRLGGGIPVDRKVVDLEAVTQKVIEEQRLLFPKRALEATSRGNLSGEWDPNRIAQVASNLLSNALQHGEHGAAIRVELDGSQEREVVLSVNNRGRIAEPVLQRLFDPFHNVQKTGRRDDGLGLGLYIVQQIAHAHGGAIDVDSDEDGTTVRVRLPRRSSDVAAMVEPAF